MELVTSSPTARSLFLRDPAPSVLSPAERERTEGFTSPARRAQFALGRTALRVLCGQFLSCPPDEVPLVALPSGAPALEGSPLFLSLSHSGDGALAALAPHPVGCDLEAPPVRSRDVLALARRFFPPEEACLLGDLEEPGRTRTFLAMWTRKEAAYKSGAVDWTRALSTAWQDGDNGHAEGLLQVCVAPGTPSGWTGRIALLLPSRAPAASSPD